MVVEPAYLLPILPDDDPTRKEKTHSPENPSLGWPSPCFCLSLEKGTSFV